MITRGLLGTYKQQNALEKKKASLAIFDVITSLLILVWCFFFYEGSKRDVKKKRNPTFMCYKRSNKSRMWRRSSFIWNSLLESCVFESGCDLLLLMGSLSVLYFSMTIPNPAVDSLEVWIARYDASSGPLFLIHARRPMANGLSRCPTMNNVPRSIR